MRYLEVPFTGEKVVTFYGTEQCPNRAFIEQTGKYYCVSGHHDCDDPEKCVVSLR